MGGAARMKVNQKGRLDKTTTASTRVRANREEAAKAAPTLKSDAGSHTNGVTAGEVWRLLLQCTMARVGHSSDVLHELGLTPGHMKVLLLLEPGAQRPMGTLAEHFGCDASTITWLVDRLEDRGLVERRSLSHDRRVKAIALTERGIATKGELESRLYEPPPEILSLRPSVLEQLQKALEKVLLHQHPHQ